MREELKLIGDAERHTFIAEFVRFGIKNGYKGPERTVLLKNIIMNDKLICDHLWFNLTKGFEECNLAEGDVIQFDGRITAYEKGYKGYKEDVRISNPVEIDYKIERPTRVKLVSTSQPKDFIEVPF